MIELHDVPGTHVEQVRLEAFATTDHGTAAVLWVAPFNCYVDKVDFYFEGTASLGHATNTFQFVVSVGTVAVGTASFGTPALAFGNAKSVDIDQTLSAGDQLRVTYGTIGTGLAAPESLVAIYYEAR